MKSLSRVALLLSLLGFAVSGFAAGTREGKWEFLLQPQYTDSTHIGGSNGSGADIDADFGFGVGLTYNLSDHFSLGGELAWSQGDYHVNAAPAAGNPGSSLSLSGDLYTTTLRMNATWNILSTPLTPFVTGGIGATYVDTNIPDGPPNSYCWWDPWWGYYCGTSQSTKNETYFSYMGAAGLRWDATPGFFIRGLAAMQWLDVGGSVGTPEFTQYRIDLGFKF